MEIITDDGHTDVTHKFMIFHHRQRDISHFVPTLEINGHSIERVNEFNFLGLTVDEHLTWNGHINKISNKISRTLGIISRVRKFLPVDILKQLYVSLVAPHLQYGILCWGFHHNKIFKLQKRAVRLITLSKYNAHTDPIFKQLNLLKVQEIFKLSCLKFYHKLKSLKLPQYFLSTFQTDSNPHQYNTRSQTDMPRNRAHTTLGTKCIRHYLPLLLQNTPRCVTDKVVSHSFNGFANYVKYYYFSQYTAECTIVKCYICRN